MSVVDNVDANGNQLIDCTCPELSERKSKSKGFVKRRPVAHRYDENGDEI